MPEKDTGRKCKSKKITQKQNKNKTKKQDRG